MAPTGCGPNGGQQFKPELVYSMPYDLKSFGIAAGLVVVALIGLVIVWEVTKSLVKLILWILAAVLVLAAAWWLLAAKGILPPLPSP